MILYNRANFWKSMMCREAEQSTQTPNRFHVLAALVLSADCLPWCQEWREKDSDDMPQIYQDPGE